MRFKNRYLLTEAISQKHLSRDQVLNAVRQSIELNFGLFGRSAVYNSLQLKQLTEGKKQRKGGDTKEAAAKSDTALPVTGLCIVRSGRDHFRMVWAAMTFITHLDNREPVMLRVIHVGGSIRSCQIAAVKYNRELLRSADINSTEETDLSMEDLAEEENDKPSAEL